MMNAPSLQGSRGPLREAARSYGLLAIVAVGLLVLSTTVAPVAPSGGSAGALRRPDASVVSPDTAVGGTPGPGSGTPALPGDSSSTGLAGATDRAAVGCPDRSTQVAGDPYSPACLAFSGDNGGATSRGVTGKDIVVGFRVFQGPQVSEVFAQLAGQRIADSRAALRDTVQAYADYFNERFQFYGRRIRVEIFDGQGSAVTELLGGGQDRALADASTAAQELGAFADVSAFTVPYADALAQQEVVNVGAAYPSAEWFEARAPYSWSNLPDSSAGGRSIGAWVGARLAGQPAAYAGGDLQGKARSFALVSPESREYQEGADQARQALSAAGVTLTRDVKYQVNFNTMSNQAAGIVAQLKDSGVTSVICACDPVMIALGMTARATEQNYYPEWIGAGVAFGDLDTVGQLYDQGQWQHALGIAPNGNPAPEASSLAYAAYKAVRPKGEPVGLSTLYYESMYVLALGIQLAGPNLTPVTLRDGLFSYPGATGPMGTWRFAPGDYTSVDDFREVWWDPDRPSPQNGNPGTWVSLDGATRRTAKTVPRGPGGFFK